MNLREFQATSESSMLLWSSWKKINHGKNRMVKNLPALHETQVWSLGWGDPLEKGMATHSSILAWRIPWTEEPDRPRGCKESDMTEWLTLSLHILSLSLPMALYFSLMHYQIGLWWFIDISLFPPDSECFESSNGYIPVSHALKNGHRTLGGAEQLSCPRTEGATLWTTRPPLGQRLVISERTPSELIPTDALRFLPKSLGNTAIYLFNVHCFYQY